MNTYKKQDIIHTLKGATFLGAGGGGSLEHGMKLLTQLEAMGFDPSFNLLSVDEMEPDKYAGMVAALGQPTAIDPSKLAEDLPAAFAALKIAATTDGHQLNYLYSGEMGGFNTMVPIFLSIVSSQNEEAKVTVVDADANGRAVPELGTCLTNARGIPPAPLAMAGHKEKDAQYRYISWPENATSAEAIARKLGGSWYDLVGFSTWIMTKEELEKNAGINYISYARRIGIALDNFDMPLFDALHSVIPQIKELVSGTIEKIITDEAGGFDKGKIIISNESDPGTKFCILFQNESLVVGNYENGKMTEVYMTAPDLISMVDTDTRKPLTNDMNEDISVGKNVAIFLTPAHYYWWDNQKAYECFRHVFEANGYDGDFVKYVPLFEANRPSSAHLGSMHLQLAFASKDSKAEVNLAEYLRKHLYNDGKVYSATLTEKGFYSGEDTTVHEPTITEQDMVRNGPEILALSKERYKDSQTAYPWAGHYISHFADEKTTRSAREASSRLIFDSFEPAILLSLALAENIGIITWPASIVPTLNRRIAGAGLSGRITKVSTVVGDNPSATEIAEIAKVMQSEGIQCIILGRAFLTGDDSANYSLAEEVQKLVGASMPIVEPNKIAIRWLELNTHMGYFHSRLSYYTPPAKNI